MVVIPGTSQRGAISIDDVLRNTSADDIYLEAGAKYLIDLNIKIFNLAVVTINKFSEQLHLEPGADGLSLKALNSSKSAFASIHFTRNFFSDCDVSKIDDTTNNLCRISMRSALAIFGRTASHGNDRAQVSCKLQVDPRADYLIAQMTYTHYVTKCFVVPFRDCVVTYKHLFNDKSRLRNRVTLHARTLLAILTQIGSDMDEVRIIATPDVFSVERFFTIEEDRKIVRKSQATIDLDSFERYELQHPSDVAISMKELRAVLVFADATGMPVNLHFDLPGRPIIVAVEANSDFLAEFVLATFEGGHHAFYQDVANVAAVMLPNNQSNFAQDVANRGAENAGDEPLGQRQEQDLQACDPDRLREQQREDSFILADQPNLTAVNETVGHFTNSRHHQHYSERAESAMENAETDYQQQRHQTPCDSKPLVVENRELHSEPNLRIGEPVRDAADSSISNHSRAVRLASQAPLSLRQRHQATDPLVTLREDDLIVVVDQRNSQSLVRGADELTFFDLPRDDYLADVFRSDDEREDDGRQPDDRRHVNRAFDEDNHVLAVTTRQPMEDAVATAREAKEYEYHSSASRRVMSFEDSRDGQTMNVSREGYSQLRQRRLDDDSVLQEVREDQRNAEFVMDGTDSMMNFVYSNPPAGNDVTFELQLQQQPGEEEERQSQLRVSMRKQQQNRLEPVLLDRANIMETAVENEDSAMDLFIPEPADLEKLERAVEQLQSRFGGFVERPNTQQLTQFTQNMELFESALANALPQQRSRPENLQPQSRVVPMDLEANLRFRPPLANVTSANVNNDLQEHVGVDFDANGVENCQESRPLVANLFPRENQQEEQRLRDDGVTPTTRQPSQTAALAMSIQRAVTESLRRHSQRQSAAAATSLAAQTATDAVKNVNICRTTRVTTSGVAHTKQPANAAAIARPNVPPPPPPVAAAPPEAVPSSIYVLEDEDSFGDDAWLEKPNTQRDCQRLFGGLTPRFALPQQQKSPTKRRNTTTAQASKKTPIKQRRQQSTTTKPVPNDDDLDAELDEILSSVCDFSRTANISTVTTATSRNGAKTSRNDENVKSTARKRPSIEADYTTTSIPSAAGTSLRRPLRRQPTLADELTRRPSPPPRISPPAVIVLISPTKKK